MPFDPLTIIFAVVAILVVWKLNGVLGQNGGFQREQPRVRPDDAAGKDGPAKDAPARNPFARNPFGPRPAVRDGADGSNVVRLPGAAPAPDPARWAAHLDPQLSADGGAATASGLEAIAGADPAFAAAPFLDGARTAYEAIITAFAAGERRTLQNLLVPEVYDGFDTALRDREKAGGKLSTTIVSEPDPKIRSAALHGRTADVAVRFQSKQISATHAADGKLIDGGPDQIVDVDDIWTFTRDVSSRNPNWKLAATQSGL